MQCWGRGLLLTSPTPQTLAQMLGSRWIYKNRGLVKKKCKNK